MACAPCAAAAANSSQVYYRSVQENITSSYTLDQLQIWLNKLNCVKLHSLYSNYNITPAVLNSYLGIINSAIRNPQNIGYFETELNKINNLVLLIISSNDC